MARSNGMRGSRALFEHADKQLRTLKVTPARPGFDLDPAFMAAERRVPNLLDVYAQFVMHRPRTEKYEAHVDRKVRELSEHVYKRVAADTRTGGCIDASMALSRMLDLEGVWNFVVRGSLVVEFPSPLSTMCFWSITETTNPATAGHVWVHAPPYSVVDVTLQHQPYPKSHASLVEGYVAARIPRNGEAEVEDLVEPEVRRDVSRSGHAPTLEYFFSRIVGLEKRIRDLGVYVMQHERIVLKYVAGAVGGSDAPLDEMAIKIDGELPLDIYRQYKTIAAPHSVQEPS